MRVSLESFQAASVRKWKDDFIANHRSLTIAARIGPGVWVQFLGKAAGQRIGVSRIMAAFVRFLCFEEDHHAVTDGSTY